jgi:hypothetical protein
VIAAAPPRTDPERIGEVETRRGGEKKPDTDRAGSAAPPRTTAPAMESVFPMTLVLVRLPFTLEVSAMEIPSCVRDAIRPLVTLGFEVGAEKSAAVQAVRALPEMAEAPASGTVAGVLIDHAIEQVVYALRCELTTATKKPGADQEPEPAPADLFSEPDPAPAVQPYTGPAKVQALNSESVRRAFASIYEMRVGGSKLGELTRADLAKWEDDSRSHERGWAVRRELAAWLKTRLKDGQKVSEAVPAKDIQKKHDELMKKHTDKGRKSA